MSGGGYKYEVTLYATPDFRHSSYVMKGVSDLQREGIVRIKPRIRGLQYRDRVVVDGGSLMRLNRPYPWSPICRIKDLESGVVTKIAIDLQDWPSWFSHHALTQADIVFKRSYDKNTAGLIEREFGVKVLPFGMSHSSKLDGNVLSDGQLRILSLLGKLESVLNDPLRLRGRLSTIRFNGHRPMAQINSKSFTDRKPSLPDRYVFFQVKYYDWNNRWSTPLNEYRAEIIRSLRQHLGNSFQGGMFFEGSVPDGYRDCITDLPTSQEHYLNLVQQATVVVSTNGFAQSPPWKLCEYLQMGKCIVSEPMAYDLGTPPVDGRELRYFQSPGECVSICCLLLENPKQVEAFGRHAQAYYSDHVDPRNRMLKILSSSLTELKSPLTSL